MISFLNNAQVLNYRPLVKENIDIKELVNRYPKNTDSENFILYKLSTTSPKSLKTDIEDNFVIENFNKNIVYPDNSKYAMQLSKVMFDSLTMRKPLPGEPANYVYFEAKMGQSLIPPMLLGTIRQKNLGLKGALLTDPFKNLFDMGLLSIPNLKDSKNQSVKFGDECKVTTSLDSKTDIITVLIAIKINDSFENIVNHGDIKFTATVYAPSQASISKKDVGENV